MQAGFGKVGDRSGINKGIELGIPGVQGFSGYAVTGDAITGKRIAGHCVGVGAVEMTEYGAGFRARWPVPGVSPAVLFNVEHPAFMRSNGKLLDWVARKKKAGKARLSRLRHKLGWRISRKSRLKNPRRHKRAHPSPTQVLH